MAPLLEVEGLHTEIRLKQGTVHAVDGVSLHVDPGETLGIVGESGCGKTMTALSIMNLLPVGGHIVKGSIRLNGREISRLDDEAMRSIRGNEIGMIFQDPLTSLNPTMTVGRQIAEAVILHREVTKEQAYDRAVEVLDLVGMPKARERIGEYPHQFSGGMRQRVMIAMALACEPKLLIADEPTTALDVTIQKQILELIDDLRLRLRMSVMLVTHDLGVIAGRADRVAVMYAGEIAETTDTGTLFANPRHPYTEALFHALPDKAAEHHELLYSIPGCPPDLINPSAACRFAPRCRYAADRCRQEKPRLLGERPGHQFACFYPVGETQKKGATVTAAAPSPLRRRAARARERGWVAAEHRAPGQGLPGHQGSGAAAAGRLAKRGRRRELRRPAGRDLRAGRRVRLRQDDDRQGDRRPGQANKRSHQFRGQGPGEGQQPRIPAAAPEDPVHVPGLLCVARPPDAGRHDPARTAGGAGHRLAPGAAAPGGGDARSCRAAAAATERYPHEFSGGQRQRLGFARALMLSPDLIVADEPVSALDVSIQAQMLNLMSELQRELGLTYLFISHDLAVVRYLSDQIGVMYLGKLVEVGPADEVYRSPAHPYTRGLIDSAPVADPLAEKAKVRAGVAGELPSAILPPSGCRFRTRCPFAQDRCAEEEPLLRSFGPGHLAACHFPLISPAPESAGPAVATAAGG